MTEHQTISVEYEQDIKTLFTKLPFRGEGGPEINEIVSESRRIVIGQLAGRIIVGDFGQVEAVLSAVAEVRPDVAFGMGTNVLDALGRDEEKSEPAAALREWLIELIANDTTESFTSHDRAWAKGTDLDELDAEALLLCISEKWPNTKLKGSLFGTRSAGNIPPKTVTPGSKLSIYDNLPNNNMNNSAHDRKLRSLVIMQYKNGDYEGVITLIEEHPLRTSLFIASMGFIHDLSLYKLAGQHLRLVSGGSVEAALEFVKDSEPRTEIGRKLLNAFQDRVKKNGRNL